MTTFQVQVQFGNEIKSFITGANNYGEAVHAVEAHLEANRERGEIVKVAPKKTLEFVQPLNGKVNEVEDIEF